MRGPSSRCGCEASWWSPAPTTAFQASEHRAWRSRRPTPRCRNARDALVSARAQLALTPVEPSRVVTGKLQGRKRMLSPCDSDIIVTVKQLLLRVPENIHRRLAARAQREGRSINAVATEILDAVADSDQGDRRARLRAAAAATGTLRHVEARRMSTARRRRIIASTRGFGPQVDHLLAQERERV
jgi:plasmid stability protein